MFEFPANQTNPSQFYQDPRPSIITRPAFRPPASPPPPFRATELPTSAVDTQAMEARIAALESRIVALSAPSTGVQVGGPETGVASEMDGADPPRMDGAEPPQYDDKE
jgi:hypothetical protein